MKKMLFALAAAMLIYVPLYAQDSSMQPVDQSQQEAGIMSFTGIIDSVTAPDAATGTASQIALMSEDGNTMSFTLEPGTMITDSEGVNITADQLKKGATFTVEYLLGPDGKNKVMSIQGD